MTSLLSYPEQLSSYAVHKLEKEMRYWSKPHPNRFFAQPFPLDDGKTDIMRWSCGFPGMVGTPWEPGYFRIFIKFGSYFPHEPPECRFGEAPYHPNVDLDGSYSVPFLSYGWNPEFTIENILYITQEMIHNPEFFSTVQVEPYITFLEDRNKYYRFARQDAQLTAYNCVMPPF